MFASVPAAQAARPARAATQSAPSDIERLKAEIAAAEKVIAERQAAWDEKFAEYQEMLRNSGGRLNRAGQMKVARLDAEARAIKAEVDAAKKTLADLEKALAAAEELAKRNPKPPAPTLPSPTLPNPTLPTPTPPSPSLPKVTPPAVTPPKVAPPSAPSPSDPAPSDPTPTDPEQIDEPSLAPPDADDHDGDGIEPTRETTPEPPSDPEPPANDDPFNFGSEDEEPMQADPASGGGSSFGGVTGKRAPAQPATVGRPGGLLGGAQGGQRDASQAGDGRFTAEAAPTPATPPKSLLSAQIPVVDLWDPVGGMVASTVVSRHFGMSERFGRRERDSSPTVELICFLGDGRRAVESSVSYPNDPQDPYLNRGEFGPRYSHASYFEKDDDDLVSMFQDSLVLEEGATAISLPDSSPASTERRRVDYVFRAEAKGSQTTASYFHASGSTAGTAVYEMQSSGDLRRPVSAVFEGWAVFGYRLHKFEPDEGSRIVYRWGYHKDGRVAFVEGKTELTEAGRKVQLDMMRSRAEKAVPLLERQLALTARNADRWEYTYDAQGRLAKAVRTTTEHMLEPPEIAELMRLMGQMDMDVLRGAEAYKANPEIVLATKAGDGTVMEKHQGALRTTRRTEMEYSAWDARGRWTKASRFKVDEAGRIEVEQVERSYTDLDPQAAAVDGSFQIVPASKSRAGAGFGSSPASAAGGGSSPASGGDESAGSAGALEAGALHSGSSDSGSSDSGSSGNGASGDGESKLPMPLVLGGAGGLLALVVIIAIAMSKRRRNAAASPRRRRPKSRRVEAGFDDGDDDERLAPVAPPAPKRSGSPAPPPVAPSPRGSASAPVSRPPAAAARPEALAPTPAQPAAPRPSPAAPPAPRVPAPASPAPAPTSPKPTAPRSSNPPPPSLAAPLPSSQPAPRPAAPAPPPKPTAPSTAPQPPRPASPPSPPPPPTPRRPQG
ncbi:MAG: hypothetical protein ACKOYN_08580 [Planctomycetota bacterium]